MKTVSKAITHTFACVCNIVWCRKTIYALCLLFQFVLFSPIFLIVLKQMVAHFYRPKKPNNRINIFPDSVLIIIFMRLKLFKKKESNEENNHFLNSYFGHTYTHPCDPFKLRTWFMAIDTNRLNMNWKSLFYQFWFKWRYDCSHSLNMVVRIHCNADCLPLFFSSCPDSTKAKQINRLANLFVQSWKPNGLKFKTIR